MFAALPAYFLSFLCGEVPTSRPTATDPKGPAARPPPPAGGNKNKIEQNIEKYISRKGLKLISLDSGHLDKPFGSLIFYFFQYGWTVFHLLLTVFVFTCCLRFSFKGLIGPPHYISLAAWCNTFWKGLCRAPTVGLSLNSGGHAHVRGGADLPFSFDLRALLTCANIFCTHLLLVCCFGFCLRSKMAPRSIKLAFQNIIKLSIFLVSCVLPRGVRINEAHLLFAGRSEMCLDPTRPHPMGMAARGAQPQKYGAQPEKCGDEP